MRGKKTDSEFLSNFISECVQTGMETPAEIAGKARSMIEEIDEEIRQIEAKKCLRSKLLDVVFAFDKPVKEIKTQDIRALSFFKIQRPDICKYLCDQLKDGPRPLTGFGSKYSKEDLMFSLKQLLENKVIGRSQDVFLRGDMFEEYLKFVLRE